jgi:hypothetical protein
MSTVIDLHDRSFLTLAEFTPEEIVYLLDLAAELKAAKRAGRDDRRLEGKEIAPSRSSNPPGRLLARPPGSRPAQMMFRRLRIRNALTMSVMPCMSAQMPANTSSVYAFSMKN